MSFSDILATLGLGKGTPGTPGIDPSQLTAEGRMPEFSGISEWINSPALTAAGLRGKVVLVDFWTYSCINCVRTLPYIKAWHERYKDMGLVIVGVHTPEFEFEKDPKNVKAAIQKFGITYPVAMDNEYGTWNAYANKYWPAHYFVDAKGTIRYHHFGEGQYDKSEAVIKTLLMEAGHSDAASAASTVAGAESVRFDKIGTPETYLGFDRMGEFGSPEKVVHDAVQRYSAPSMQSANVLYFDGLWEVRKEYAAPAEAGARIIYKVRAAKANLVLGGKGEVEVMIDGKAASESSKGSDVQSSVINVDTDRLYNVMDAKEDYGEHQIELTFRTPGVRAYAFTFG
jgi:thiol-disulfide isomerase/thioredoxin